MKFDQPLNDAQRALVEDTLPVARWTVRKYIASNENIVGLSLEDLHQEAYLALCGAASTYNDRHAQFSTYAVTVIHNHLIDYCRLIYSGNQNLPTLSIDAPCSADGTSNFLENASAVDDSFEEKCLSRIWVNDFLEQRKASYSGCAKLGIEALELKVIDGYGVTDIAKMYASKPNLVGAWISKATQKIREDMTMSEYAALNVENILPNL